MNFIINGKRYTFEQVLQVLIIHNQGVKWFDDAFLEIDGILDKRTRIANAVNARQLEFVGKDPDRYKEIRDRIEKEEKDKEELI